MLRPSVTRESISGLLRDLSGWLLLGGLMASPLAYGTTAWWSENLLAKMLLATFVLWILSHIIGGEFIPHPGLIDLGLLYILVAGWWMTLNARGIYDFQFRDFFHLSAPVPWAPGTIDKLASRSDMERVTGLFGAFIVARSLGADPVWRRRLLIMAVMTGLSIAVIGVILKLGGPSLMAWFWLPEKISPTDFAFFRYHGNAGAYLNLTWPIALGLALDTPVSGRLGPISPHRFWWGAALVILIALQINLSKGAIAIAVMLGVLFALAWIKGTPLLLKMRRLTGLACFVAVSLIATAFLGRFSPYSTAWRMWEKLSLPENREGSFHDRPEIQQIALHMAGDAGWWGFGPGTFEAAFTGYQDAAGKPLGRFDEAHEDYLQTVIEWGSAGAVAWGYLVFGGLWRVWQHMTKAAREPTGRFWIWYAVLLALLGVLLHATFDFPLEIDSIRLYVLVFLALGWSRDIEVPGHA